MNLSKTTTSGSLKIKIARNDGTDYADYLLNGVNISSIAIGSNSEMDWNEVQTVFYLISRRAEKYYNISLRKTLRSYLMKYRA